METLIKNSLGLFMRQTPQDAAKTQVFLSASSVVCEKDVHGEYWVPKLSWTQRYVGSQKLELKTSLAKDEAEWKRLWEFCEEAVTNT